MAGAPGRLPRARARDHRRLLHRGDDPGRPVHPPRGQGRPVVVGRHRSPGCGHPRHHAGRRRDAPGDVRRGLRRGPVHPGAHRAVPPHGLCGGPVVHQHDRRGRLLGGRVLHPRALVGAGHDGDGLGPRPHRHLRGPRAAVHPRLHAGHLAQARPQGQRGGPEVLPDGCVRLGHHAVRDVVALRLHRLDGAGRDRGEGGRRPGQRQAHDRPGHPDGDRRVRLQGLGRPVPHVGPGHLRRCPHADHGVPGHRVQGRRLRGPARAHLHRLLRPPRRVGAPDVGPGRGHHDGGQPHRSAPEQHRAHARLLGHRPGRLHPGAVRRRRFQRVGRAWAPSRPSSPTC